MKVALKLWLELRGYCLPWSTWILNWLRNPSLFLFESTLWLLVSTCQILALRFHNFVELFHFLLSIVWAHLCSLRSKHAWSSFFHYLRSGNEVLFSVGCLRSLSWAEWRLAQSSIIPLDVWVPTCSYILGKLGLRNLLLSNRWPFQVIRLCMYLVSRIILILNRSCKILLLGVINEFGSLRLVDWVEERLCRLLMPRW